MRAVALKRHAALVRWLKARAADETLDLHRREGVGYDGTVTIEWELIFDKDDGPDWLTFYPSGWKNRGSISTAGGGITTINLRMEKAKPDEDMEPVIRDLQKPRVRDTFVHEYVHWLDTERADHFPRTSEVLKTQGRTAYYRDPFEFNAFFQHGATNLDRGIRGLLRSPIRKTRRGEEMVIDAVALKLPATAQRFIKDVERGVIGGWEEEFVSAMTSDPKWRRKFRKRLAGLHQHLRRNYAKEMKA